MKTVLSFAISLACSLFATTPFLAQPQVAMNASSSTAGLEKTFHVSKKSVLKLEGKTNINGFTCHCNEAFQPQRLVAERNTDGSLSFKSAALKLRIVSLDCGNKIMNKDLQKALNATEHPHISIELKKVEQDKCNRLSELKDWVKMKALAKISLNGVSKEYWISITAKKCGADQFRFIGTKTLNMTDFGVTPPNAMMGMIKVQDAIAINLDLDVVVE
ncbi:MAG: YceI family protein [Saprospiraceae bacterium]|jgi:polyisoprenoid-binding protein YceI|nr:YceI family protein [Saprospiraceae bacterium]